MSQRTNPILKVQLNFSKDRNEGGGGISKTFQNVDVVSQDIDRIISNLKAVKAYYISKRIFDRMLVSIFYKTITPKSRRVAKILCHYQQGYTTVVGSRYQKDEENHLYHVVTHFVNSKEIDTSIQQLEVVKHIIDEKYGGIFQSAFLGTEFRNQENDAVNGYNISKCDFHQNIIDVSQIRKIDVLFADVTAKKESLVTFFNIFPSKEALRKYLIDIGVGGNFHVIDSTNAILSGTQITKVIDVAPFTIAMSVEDFANYSETISEQGGSAFARTLPQPTDEPYIGCFDTAFEENCYLKEYVEFENVASDYALSDFDSKIHGTKVSSILVEGGALNDSQGLNDHCGRFRVKLFGVGGSARIDFLALLRAIEEKVEKYHSIIKVWNVSLGDIYGVNKNSISLIGAKIDEISKKFDVLFVICGTNLSTISKDRRIGAPADSLNAIVVNSVDQNNVIASYSRHGPVLTTLMKPDVSYYGGTREKPLICYSPIPNDYSCYGTSFAAPFIARKAAYLIHRCHFSVQAAKALIIDAAAGWNKHSDVIERKTYGFGVVPVKIEDILSSKKSEIRFVITGKTLDQYTMETNIPIILSEDKKFSYTAKLTFCYFTGGNRCQGVDYASQEIAPAFGPVVEKVHKKDKSHYFRVNSIDKDSLEKSSTGDTFLTEEAAVEHFQKWNNTKILMEDPTIRHKRKDYQNKQPFWGLSINHLERFGTMTKSDWENPEILSKVSIKFAAVATFKTIDNTDADYKSYLQSLRNHFIVEEVNIENENKIFIQENQELLFD
ncbi:S8 family peptidase [bacterium]|nr:S8 family peptidase [bacterium]MDY2687106.1 S8 family peptidase [Candidatus Enteromonas sp.]MDY5298964.1 S8 family peptidase [Candidatus Enteromonas sp.]